MSEGHVPGALIINGRTLLQDPAFEKACEDLVATVEALWKKHPEACRKNPPTKILAAI